MRSLFVLVLSVALCACKLGPNYKRPPVALPDQYRGTAPTAAPQAAPSAAPQPSPESFAEMKWWTVFQDRVLEDLIREALTDNYDVRIAATRILQAAAQLGITRADQFPSVSGSASIQNVRNQFFQNAPTFDSVSIQANYIVDFWGQFRRATEAARDNLLATEFAQQLVRTTLISNVASNYFLLRQFDLQLKYSKQTLAVEQEILRINTINFKGGEFAKTDVLQAQILVQQAESQIITLEQSIEQTENAISVLLGKNPGAIARGLSLAEQPHLPEIPTGIPSTILRRRPDVRQAEMLLASANANVGVAKAAFFPQFSLTGAFGAQSTSLTSFLNGPATFWSLVGQAVQPLFEGGRITSNYHLAWAQRDQAELSYQQTVLLAMEDVSNNLVGYDQSRKNRMKIEEQTATYAETARLADVRFRGGYTNFLEVLVTQQQYFGSQLALAQAWDAELQNYVQLYRALGGGWEP
jgi:outer membrane protein, multidrug efflux system